MSDLTKLRLVCAAAMAEILDVEQAALARMARESLLPTYRLGERPSTWRYDVEECLGRLRHDHACSAPAESVAAPHTITALAVQGSEGGR